MLIRRSNVAARLERKSFFVAGKAMEKRLGAEDGKAAIKILDKSKFLI